MDSPEDRRRGWREDRKRRIAMQEAKVEHGTQNAYSNWGCRCDPCKTAKAEYHAHRYETDPKYRARMQARLDGYRRSVQAAPGKSRTMWTGAEMAIATERDSSGKYVRTRKEVALLLGRSYQAVERMRQKCLHDPRKIEAAGEPDVA